MVINDINDIILNIFWGCYVFDILKYWYRDIDFCIFFFLKILNVIVLEYLFGDLMSMKIVCMLFCEKVGIIFIVRKVIDVKWILCELKSYENEFKY